MTHRAFTSRSAVSRLDTPAITELRGDLARGKGTPVRRTLWAVDAFDIIKYCFPINPRPHRIDHFDPDEVADDHAAVAHILFESGQPPVLLPDYLAELLGFAADVTKELSGQGARAQFDHQLRDGLSHELERTISHDEPRLEQVEENFAAAVLYFSNEVLGLGLNCFQRLARETLHSFPAAVHDLGEPLRTRIARWHSEYQPDSTFLDTCEQAFAEIFPPREETPSQEMRRRLNDRSDAICLHRVVCANRELRALQGDALDGWRVHLLSSSWRVVALVRHLQGKTIPGVTFDDLAVVRTPAQVIALLTYRELIGSVDESQREKRLKQVDEGLEWRASTLCDKCVLHGHSNDACVHAVHCRIVHEGAGPVAGETKLQAAENLALFVRRREDILSKLKGFTSKNTLLKWIAQTVSDENLATESWARLDALRGAIRVASFLALESASIGLRDNNLSSERDWARSFSTVVPWLIDVQTPTLRSILEDCKRTLLHGYGAQHEKPELLRAAFARLLAVEPPDLSESERTTEWQLATTVLLLTGGKVSEELALSLSNRLVAFSTEDMSTQRRRRDVLYVASWANRRIGNYHRALEHAEEGLRLEARDPRFLHGSAMALRGLVRREHGANEDAIAQDPRQQKAILLYGDAADAYDDAGWIADDDRQLLRAVCLNQFAFNSALSARRAPSKRGAEDARRALRMLKELMPPTRWDAFPEFYHTEAFVETKDALERTGEARRQKLESARATIEKAILHAPTRDDYRQLEDAIVQLLETAG